MNSLKRLAAHPMRAPSPRVVARFAAAFIVAILLWFVLRDPLVGLHMRVANVILQKSGYASAQLVLKDAELYLQVRPASTSAEEQTDRLYRRGNRYGITWSSIFFMCLLLCVPLRVARRRWRYLLIVALIFFSHDSITLILSALSHPAVHAASGEISASGTWAAQLHRGLAAHQFLVFSVLCLLFLPLFVGEPQPRASSLSINEPPDPV
ncbi:MAG: hypothetical protein ACI9OU_001767 [Candidatus Promineifilaceae bacterium]|jgi:hypothetical protein